ncbi:A-kinase anchor protein 14 [Paralichthys olivaceus]|uniref:A-kinase anchor protein 14 n=1 Tax=Paralichthys olivaceus TaxID=8255 RepID=UPI00097D7321|nr:PREDICTED: A-kinase anchor protein 14 [Paralichthys olivaceus]
MVTTAFTEQITNKLLDRNMENRASPSNVSFTAESAQLMKILLERHTHTGDQEETPETTSVDWVSSEDFTVDEGKRQIGEHIRTWELQPRWFHSLDFLCTTEEQHLTFHHYRARFSTPTPREPIQGTACVYFVMCESKLRARDQPVEVGFVVESNRLVHKPGATRFTEKWLLEVIESKAALRHAAEAPRSAPRATSS